MAAVIPILNNT